MIVAYLIGLLLSGTYVGYKVETEGSHWVFMYGWAVFWPIIAPFFIPHLIGKYLAKRSKA